MAIIEQEIFKTTLLLYGGMGYLLHLPLDSIHYTCIIIFNTCSKCIHTTVSICINFANFTFITLLGDDNIKSDVSKLFCIQVLQHKFY